MVKPNRGYFKPLAGNYSKGYQKEAKIYPIHIYPYIHWGILFMLLNLYIQSSVRLAIVRVRTAAVLGTTVRWLCLDF